MATATAPVLDLAKYLVLRFQVEGACITPAKLQKLLYYIQAWHLVYLEKHPLFKDEPQAWVNGPVYMQVYKHYIDHQMYDCIAYSEFGSAANEEEAMREVYNSLSLSEKQQEVIESVVRAYGFMDTNKLIAMTHTEDPWVNARAGLSPIEKGTKAISHESMAAYYGARLTR